MDTVHPRTERSVFYTFFYLFIIFVVTLALLLWHNRSELTLLQGSNDKPMATATILTLNADRDLYQAAAALRDYVWLAQHDTPRSQRSLQIFISNQHQAYQRISTAQELAQAKGISVYPNDINDLHNAYRNWQTDTEDVIRFVRDNNFDQANTTLRGKQESSFEKLRTLYNAFGEALEHAILRSTQAPSPIPAAEETAAPG